MTNNHYEDFEAYLQGRLEADKKQELEQALLDPAVQADLQTYRAVRQTIAGRWHHRQQTAQLEATLIQYSQQYFSPATSPRMSVRRRLLMAASFLLVVILSGVLLVKNQYRDTRLISAYLQEYPLSKERGGEGIYRYPQAMLAYDNRDWTAAAAAFAKISPENAQYVEAQLYAGYAYLHDRSYEQAAQAFQRVATLADGKKQANAQWHLALAQISTTPRQTLPPALNTILQDPQHPFFSRAQELEAALQSFWR